MLSWWVSWSQCRHLLSLCPVLEVTKGGYIQAAGQGARATLECEGGPHTMTNVPRGYGGGNAYDIWASVSELRK